jgi:hypothetical protein
MGMDVYGENPKNVKHEKPKMPNFDKISEEEKDEYLSALHKWEEENVGTYFRNNIWHWRPLWGYVGHVCHDILSEEDYIACCHNDGYLIDGELADKIARRLSVELMSGKTAAYAAEYLEKQNALPDKKPADLKTGDAAWGRHYPFSVENVANFQKFCAASGGFRVC